MDEVRTIVYLWWRKDDESLIKFGDHTESIDNKNWQIDTELYIQKTAAPKESKTFKDKIDFIYYDITDYAKKVNKNYKFARIDNYITRLADLDKYRLGQTDQFKLPKFEIDIDEFIDKIKDVIYGGHNLEDRIPITGDVHISDLRNLEMDKILTFNFPTENKEIDVLSILAFFEVKKILVITLSNKYKELFSKFFEFNKFIIRLNDSSDGQFMFADKKIKITSKEDEDITKYDCVVKDLDDVSIYLRT